MQDSINRLKSFHRHYNSLVSRWSLVATLFTFPLHCSLTIAVALDIDRMPLRMLY